MNNHSLLNYSINHPKTVTGIMVALTLIIGSLISLVQVDTDPENMLPANEDVRVFHNNIKQEFDLQDIVVLGVVDEENEYGAFTPSTLQHVHELTELVKTLSDEHDPELHVVGKNLIAPGTVDAIEQAGLGQVRFEWLMKEPPTTQEEALRVRDLALDNPLLRGTMVSEDGMALAIYIPISEKKFAYQVREALLEKIESFDTHEEYHITGLPVAEDTFGVEMFIQMAISAPLAMGAIFVLMLVFFKNVKLIVSPMIVAMVSVIITMGLMIGTGHTVHIMSSMIPIFLMPIAVVDSVHILSEFFDLYQKTRNRKETLKQVMHHLYKPMLFTSITSATGFASLALAPIPPVQVFGIFVAFGILLAWFLTIVFVPAYIAMMSEETLNNFGLTPANEAHEHESFIARHLHWIGTMTYKRSKAIIGVASILIAVSAYGMSQIVINDNPVNWFEDNHEIRVADKVLNSHFGGTYEAFLVLEGAEVEQPTVSEIQQKATAIVSEMFADAPEVQSLAAGIVSATNDNASTADEAVAFIADEFEYEADDAEDQHYDMWLDAADAVASLSGAGQTFKQPEVLAYIEKLQQHLISTGEVGKSNSVTDIVKKVHQELFEGDSSYYSIPQTSDAVAQTLISFQNSHKPQDLFHLVTPSYDKANIWVQLKQGDNLVMEHTLESVDEFFATNPAPAGITHKWAGLTYLNVVWQDKMVTGMFESFISSFVVVLILMSILFRSVLWGLLAMIPLTATIAIIYGIVGFVGKDYDMPIAVLSSLSLGLAVDFAIHFLQRSREAYKEKGSWKDAVGVMFEEPARAITRNVIVVAVGFMPLLLAPLMPYKTVGFFLASIMAVSGLATMLILPSMIHVLRKQLFKTSKTQQS